MTRMISLPVAVARITTASMPGANRRKVSGRPLLGPQAAEACGRSEFPRMFWGGGGCELLYGKVDNKVLEPGLPDNSYSSRMFSAFLTAENVETLTRALFSLLVPDYSPSHLYWNRSRDNEGVRTYFQKELTYPLAEILRHQEAPEMAAQPRFPGQFKIGRIGGHLEMSLLTGNLIPDLLQPVARAWVKFGTSFGEYTCSEEALAEERTPIHAFYRTLEGFARKFER